MSKIADIFNGVFRSNNRFFRGYGVSLGGFKLSRFPFADVIYYNAVELLTDLNNDVTWKFGKGRESIAAAFVRFYSKYAKVAHTKFFDEGFIIVVHETIGEGTSRVDNLRFASKSEYIKKADKEYVIIEPTQSLKNSGATLLAIASPTIETTGQSDKQLLRPFLSYLDNALNASNTITERLGAMVVASPAGTQNTFGRLNEEEKKEIEKQIREDYGALSQQSQFLLLPKEMNMQVISLAALDLKTEQRVRASVLAIADRIKVPANQIGMIDAESSKALSNGSELMAGDLAKYKSFERLLDQTFVRLAKELGLTPGAVEEIDGIDTPIYYGIYNKPKQPTEGDIDITKLNQDLLGVLTTDEKREALGYKSNGTRENDETILAQTLGVGGTQSLVAVIESESMTDDEKRGTLEVLFGLSKEQTLKLIPYKQQ